MPYSGKQVSSTLQMLWYLKPEVVTLNGDSVLSFASLEWKTRRHHTAAIRGHSLDADEEDAEATWIFDLDLAAENHDAARWQKDWQLRGNDGA
ncbi:hypothetical protein MKX08_007697 [Trichoderma sp. CBMAI-0020]|nr:hypothetical protein MKX08_007697 [Trichoderma sp. CBMAI-0020]